jgi:hypothetical protein
VLGTGSVEMSSGMSMTRPRVEIGVQIKNVRAMPVQAYVVDDGPADLLLGSDFLRLIFEVGGSFQPGKPHVTLEPPTKRERTALALRIIGADEQPELIEVERFLSAVRRVHNCAVVAETGLHQHEDWPRAHRDEAKREAIHNTIVSERSLGEQQSLHVAWVESGSIWVTLKSGAVSGLSWLSQLFKTSMDAKLQHTVAEAASAEERARIAQLTRNEIVRARQAEENLRYAKSIGETRDEWRKQVIAEIDFKRALTERIKDPVAREAVQEELDKALADLAESKMVALIEHLPEVSSEYPDLPRIGSGENLW